MELATKSLQASKRKLKSGHVGLTETTNYLAGFTKLNKDFSPPKNKVTRECEFGFDQNSQHWMVRTGINLDSHYQNVNGTQLYRAQELEGKRSSVGLTNVKRPVHRSNILDFGYRVEGEWVADLIGKFTFIDEEFHPDLGPLIRVEGRAKNGHHCILTVAAKFGVVTDYVMSSQDGHTISRSIDEFQDVVGLKIPKRASLLWVAVIDGKKEPYLSIEYVIHQVSLNRVPVGFLEVPKLPQGAIVKDDRVGKYFEVGPNGELLFRGSFGKQESPKSGGVVPFGWLFIAGSMSLLFGGVRFIALRRRSLSR